MKKTCLKMITFFLLTASFLSAPVLSAPVLSAPVLSASLLSASAFAGQTYHCGPLGYFSTKKHNQEKFQEKFQENFQENFTEPNSTTNFLVIHFASSNKKGTAFFTLGMEYEGNQDALHEINLETQTGEKMVYSFSHDYEFGKILIPRNSFGKRSDYVEVEFLNKKNKEMYSCFSTFHE